jgi:hypothetical protein
MKTSSSFNSKSRILFYSLLLFLLSLPFTITDLYFGF